MLLGIDLAVTVERAVEQEYLYHPTSSSPTQDGGSGIARESKQAESLAGGGGP